MADKYLKVDIITPQSVVFSGDALGVNLPGSLSPFEVLINHAPIVSSLDSGVIRIRDLNKQPFYFATGTGFVEVKHNAVSILVESAVRGSDINKSIVEANIESLKSELHKTTNITEKQVITARLDYEEAKLKAAVKTNFVSYFD